MSLDLILSIIKNMPEVSVNHLIKNYCVNDIYELAHVINLDDLICGFVL